MLEITASYINNDGEKEYELKVKKHLPLEDCADILRGIEKIVLSENTKED